MRMGHYGGKTVKLSDAVVRLELRRSTLPREKVEGAFRVQHSADVLQIHPKDFVLRWRNSQRIPLCGDWRFHFLKSLIEYSY